MSTANESTPVGENPNAETIAGLLAIAEWLTEHPELPDMRVLVHGRADTFLSVPAEEPRERMRRFAESLDCRVEEGVEYTDVRLAAEINRRTVVMLRTSVGSLGGQQRTPQYDYQPITETCSACNGLPVPQPPAWHHPWSGVCQVCKGASRQLNAPADAERRAA